MRFVDEANVDPACRAILFKIAMRLDDGDDELVVRNGAGQLARWTGVSPRSLVRHLAELERGQLLLRARPSAAGHSGTRLPTLYLLNVDKLTPQQWSDRRLKTPGLLLPIAGSLGANLASSSSRSADPGVSDKTPNWHVVPDQAEPAESLGANLASSSSRSADPGVSDKTPNWHVVPDQAEPAESLGANLASSDLPIAHSPSSRPSDGAGGRDPGGQKNPATATAQRLVDELPWDVKPGPTKRQIYVVATASALARGWLYADICRQVTHNRHRGAEDPDAVMIGRLRELPYIEPPYRPAATATAPQSQPPLIEMPEFDVDRNVDGAKAARAALDALKRA
jgi:hypothetical protein